MTKEQMEEAVSEMREVIAAFERGALQEEEGATGLLELLRKILRGREAWLRGEVIISVLCARDRAACGEPEWPNIQRQFAEIADGARMYTQAEAVEFLRSWGHIGHMSHSPLRKIEQEWLDRIFVGRERISKGWLCLATVMATVEESGAHVENHLQVPCNCPDKTAVETEEGK